MKVKREDLRGIQLIVGIFGISVIAGVIAGTRYLAGQDGFTGELFRLILGFLSTPFCLEICLVTMGLFLVVGINTIVMRMRGDECVYLEVETSNKERLLKENSGHVKKQ